MDLGHGRRKVAYKEVLSVCSAAPLSNGFEMYKYESDPWLSHISDAEKKSWDGERLNCWDGIKWFKAANRELLDRLRCPDLIYLTPQESISLATKLIPYRFASWFRYGSGISGLDRGICFNPRSRPEIPDRTWISSGDGFRRG